MKVCFASVFVCLLAIAGHAKAQVLLGIDEPSLVEFLNHRGPFHQSRVGEQPIYYFDSEMGRTVYVLDAHGLCCSVTMAPASKAAYGFLKNKLMQGAIKYAHGWWVRATPEGTVYIKPGKRFGKYCTITCTQWKELLLAPLPDFSSL